MGYGYGMTFAADAEIDKEHVRQALCGKLPAGEDEEGFVYEDAPRAECERFILEVIDKWYHMAKLLADSGRAVERIMERHGFALNMQEYMREVVRAEKEYDTYVYEGDLDELREEIDAIERGEGVDE